MPLPDAVHEVVAHFLTEFPPDQKVRKTIDYVMGILRKRYSPEFSAEIIDKYFDKILEILVVEHDARIGSGELLRYEFVDDTGKRIRGRRISGAKDILIFQDAINALSDREFEELSARVLVILGCKTVYVTPASHDQGLDAFGYASPFSGTMLPDCRCATVCLAQAKHYKKHKIGSRDIREFVGSRELAAHKIYSTADDKYPELEIKPYGPAVMIIVTTEELPRQVMNMSGKTGIVVLSAKDLAHLFLKARVIAKDAWTRRKIERALRSSLEGLQYVR